MANQTQRPMWGQIHSLMNYILTNNFSRKYTFLKNCYSDRYIILYISLKIFILLNLLKQYLYSTRTDTGYFSRENSRNNFACQGSPRHFCF